MHVTCLDSYSDKYFLSKYECKETCCTLSCAYAAAACSPTAAAPQLKQPLVPELSPFPVFCCTAGLSCVFTWALVRCIQTLPVLTVLQQALLSSACQTFTQSPIGSRLCHQLPSLSSSSVFWVSFVCPKAICLRSSFTVLPQRHFQVLGYQ